MNAIPTAADWAADPDAALAACQELAKATNAHSDASTQAIAIGIAAQVIAAAAPIAGQAIGGPIGALAGAAVGQVAVSLASQRTAAMAALTPNQQALVTTAIQVGVTEAQAKLAAKGT